MKGRRGVDICVFCSLIFDFGNASGSTPPCMFAAMQSHHQPLIDAFMEPPADNAS